MMSYPCSPRPAATWGPVMATQRAKEDFGSACEATTPSFDFQSLTRDLGAVASSTAAPDQSLMLLKPTGQVPHEGGIRFAADSDEARAAAQTGSPPEPHDDQGTAPRLKSLRVFTGERINTSRRRTEQLRVTAEFDDGSTRDVTRQAAFDLSDPTLAEVSQAGLVHARGPCEDRRRRSLPEGPWRQPACLPGRPARFFLGRRRTVATWWTSTSSPGSNTLESIPPARPRIRSSCAGPTLTRSAGCPRPSKPERSWPITIR